MSKYAWRTGYRAAVPAQVAGEELARIQTDNDGKLTPAVVVEEAKPKNAPLHPAFEWDNKEAARLYREDQARHLIRSVHVIETPDDGPATRQPVYVHVEPVDEEPCYVTTAYAMSDDDLRAQVLAAAISDLRAFERRYAHLKELANVIEEARKVLQSA